MNIWLINHYAVPPQYYPLARQTYFAKHLMAMGHMVTIFAASTVHNTVPMQNLITDGAPYREITEDGVHYVLVRCRNYEGNGLSRIYNMCEFAWKLPGVCKRFPKPDAIVSTSMPPMSCAMGVRLGKKWGCKNIGEVADLWPESIVAYGIAGPHNPAVIALRRLEKWIYKTADAMVFTMEGAYDYIVEQGWEREIPRSKVHYINNGVDLAAFDYNRDRFPVEDPDLDDPDTFKVVYTGSIRLANKISCVVEAAELLWRQGNRSVKFLLYGDGDKRAELEAHSPENVVFKGKVPKENIPAVLSKGDVNLWSFEENSLLRYGFSPNKLFDYLASGKPVLVTAHIPHDPILAFGAGIEAGSNTPEGICAAVLELYGMEPEQRSRMGTNAAEAAKAFDFAKLTEQLAEIIERI